MIKLADNRYQKLTSSGCDGRVAVFSTLHQLQRGVLLVRPRFCAARSVSHPSAKDTVALSVPQENGKPIINLWVRTHNTTFETVSEVVSISHCDKILITLFALKRSVRTTPLRPRNNRDRCHAVQDDPAKTTNIRTVAALLSVRPSRFKTPIFMASVTRFSLLASY